MGVAGSLNDNGSITVDVKSYWPNDYGLYCMAGNVNEWVQDVYRPLTSEDVDGFNPFRGNVYTDLRRDANGSVVGKDKLGRLYVDTVKDLMLQTDIIIRKAITGITGMATFSQQYQVVQTGKLKTIKKVHSECMHRIILQGNTDFVTLINDNARVYKGGSWKDRAYWLNPSTRRFLDQESSRDDIGFRCAMIRVGSPSGF